MAIFTFYYNQGGENRMPFAKAVAEIIGVKPKYSGTPKCAYIMDFATVTREGNIEVDDQTDNAKLVNLVQKLMERGYMTEQSGNDWDDEDGPADTGAAAVDADAAAVDGAVADTVFPDGTETIVAAADATVPTAPADLSTAPLSTTISVPREIFTASGIENLKKLLWAKNELICKALDIENTDIEVTDNSVSFPWFGDLSAEEVKYISQFISGLCEFANTSKRVTSKRHSEDNPKFAMRTWAIRLGFIGAEHKDLRKFLMKRLPGDAAWRFGKPDNVLPAEPRLPINVQVGGV